MCHLAQIFVIKRFGNWTAVKVQTSSESTNFSSRHCVTSYIWNSRDATQLNIQWNAILLLNWTLGDIERSNSKSLTFRRLRTSYIWSPTVPLDWPCVSLNVQFQVQISQYFKMKDQIQGHIGQYAIACQYNVALIKSYRQSSTTYFCVDQQMHSYRRTCESECRCWSIQK